MTKRIAPKWRVQVHLSAWRKHRGLTQQQLADRLGCDVMTVSRWELHKVAVTTEALAALAEALGGDWMEPEDLFHHPDRPSPNQLLRGQPKEIVDLALKLIAAITTTGSKRHDEDWQTKFFRDRSAEEVERMKKTLRQHSHQSQGRLMTKRRAKTPFSRREGSRLFRQAAGYKNQSAFARGLEISPQRYSNFDNGFGLPHGLARRIVALVPGCSLDWLYDGVETGFARPLLRRRIGAQSEQTAQDFIDAPPKRQPRHPISFPNGPRRDLNQVRLAEALGADKSVISRWV